MAKQITNCDSGCNTTEPEEYNPALPPSADGGGEGPTEVTVDGVVEVIGGPIDLGPTSASGVDCDGNPVNAQGVGVFQTVPHPDAVQMVRICRGDNYESTILCDSANANALVVAVTTYDPDTGVPSTSYYDLDGNPWTGDSETLFQCDAEPSATTVPYDMCDAGTTGFLRWFVQENGQPTGASFDTDLDGQPYTPIGPVEFGSCAITPDTVKVGFTRQTHTELSSYFINDPNVQSVTLTVLSGEVEVHDTVADNEMAVPAGVSLTWSVQKDQNEELTPLPTFETTSPGGDYILHWTYS